MYVSQAFPRARAAEEETPVFGIVIRPPRPEVAPGKGARVQDAADREKGFARS